MKVCVFIARRPTTVLVMAEGFHVDGVLMVALLAPLTKSMITASTI